MNIRHSRQFSFAALILFFILFFQTNVWAQNGTVSVDFNNSSPKHIIENLESRTPYRFVYQNDINLDSPKITLKKNNVSIDEVLAELQKLTGLNFKRNENNIAINKAISPSSKKKRSQGISGKIVDNYGKPLFDAIIIANPGAVTMFTGNDGTFILELEPGFYNVEITAQGFTSRLIENIPVDAGNSTPLNIALELAEQNISLDEVVVTGQQYKSTSSTEGLLLQQKRAAQFSDGISAEQISRTPDSDVGATLKRITGITTIDNKYVVVRSMGERWNQAVMDGINLPSTDAQQQNFAFDIIPTAMVESIVVSKTPTPDMYANFAGGQVEVKTKDIPRQDFTSFTISTSYNDRATFQQALTKQRGAYDYFGFDDGTRDTPASTAISLPETEAESGPYFDQTRKYTQDNFTTYKTKADPNTTLQFGIGRVYELKDSKKWGFTGSLLFRNTQDILQIEHTERGDLQSNTQYYPAGISNGSITNEYPVFEKYGYRNHGASYSYNTTLSGMFNAGYQYNNSRITLRNSYIHMYDNQLTQITGWTIAEGKDNILSGAVLPITKETNYPVYTDFIQSKLEGNHRFNGFDLNWYVAYSKTAKDTKDATFTDMGRERVGDDIMNYYEVYNSAFNINRRNFDNDEQDYNVGVNISRDFTLGKIKNTIKTGYFETYKYATNYQELVNLNVVGQDDDKVKIYSLADALDGSQYHWGGLGWTKEGFFGNRYEGEVIIHSPFLMLDNRIGNFIRLVWGLRAESFTYHELERQAQFTSDFDAPLKKDDQWQYLPSINLTVSPSEKTNIRLSYNKSVIRPQFSERLNIPFYDPIRSATVRNYTGGIISSVSENYDAKFEYFPSLGQVMSIGVYSKSIKNPIETVNTTGGELSRLIYIMNSHSAKLWGVEAEILRNLSFLGEGKELKNIYLYANGAINKTEVTGYEDIDGTGGLYKADRPLFGQSPYTYNLGLDYIGDRFSFNIRQNATGDQYLLVGFDYNSEEIRRPYAVTDAMVSYKFFKEKNLELKLSGQNIFDRVLETYNNQNSYSKIAEGVPNGSNPREFLTLAPGTTNKYDEDTDRKLFKAYTGRTFKISINYSF
jgi:TonB-dependent receptor